MKPVLVFLVTICLGGCGRLYLDSHGSASMCAQDPRLAPAVARAVSYWNEAGLKDLAPCAAGSVTVVVTARDEIPAAADAASYEANDGSITTRVSDAVWTWDAPYTDTVLAHELGHALGLPHVPDKDSVMFARSSRLQLPVYAGDAAVAEGLLAGKTFDGPGKM